MAIASSAGIVRILSKGKLRGRKGAYKIKFEVSGVTQATQIALIGLQARTIKLKKGRKRFSIKGARVKGSFTSSRSGVYTATVRADSKFKKLLAARKSVGIKLTATASFATRVATSPKTSLSLVPDKKKKRRR